MEQLADAGIACSGVEGDSMRRLGSKQILRGEG